MAVYKKGNDWYIDYYVSGRRKRERVGPDKRLAQIVLKKRAADGTLQHYSSAPSRRCKSSFTAGVGADSMAISR